MRIVSLTVGNETDNGRALLVCRVRTDGGQDKYAALLPVEEGGETPFAIANRLKVFATAIARMESEAA